MSRDLTPTIETALAAYAREADLLLLKAQRGRATLEEWQAKVDEILERFPYSEE